ncbi:Glycoside hydrolase, family 61 [Niveomyces insectorum RCEF 264]|uniref:lytic cellulose monooxygenase (C4-dehydrogenating) n=1 Tax=Niveomyces insectorum RCEF 264 TaxID=1081102 RepID=A0A167QD74_9HYPO|nr:Glycoside hydrolase, family 61 [Niveomyces insectorum RCEF 264]
MSFLSRSAVAGVVLFAARATAHGIATAMVHWPDGTFYHGYDPSYQYQQPPPVVIGWSIPNDLTNTFISPSGYATPDIVCHLAATPAGIEAPVNAGDILELQWNKWPASHKGPVLDYLANCNGPCETADKTKLEFFKISEAGLVDLTTGTWAADQLLANNLSWSVRLPTDIAPGNYVLRHEMIALHAAGNPNGAQNYPFCFNLAISSNGTKTPAGIPATDFYKAKDPGVLFDLFTKFTTYIIPGPALYTGALTAAQTKPGPIKATASGVASYVAAAAAGAAATPGSHRVPGYVPRDEAPPHTTFVTATLRVKSRRYEEQGE